MARRKGSRKSLKCPRVYKALRRKGYSKKKSARISNAKCKNRRKGGRKRR